MHKFLIIPDILVSIGIFYSPFFVLFQNFSYLCNVFRKRQALTSTNHHLENKESPSITIKSVCAYGAGVSMDS